MAKNVIRVEFEVQAEQESPALHRLRALALAEIAALTEVRIALGDGPWQPEVPTLDEQVVLNLYRERSTLPERAAARARAYHPAARPGLAAEFEFQMLRAIALEHPALSSTVWRMLDTAPRLIGRAG